MNTCSCLNLILACQGEVAELGAGGAGAAARSAAGRLQRPPLVAGLKRSSENVLRFDHQPVAPASAPAAPRKGVKRSEKPLMTKKPFTESTWFKNIQPAVTSALKRSVRASALPAATRT